MQGPMAYTYRYGLDELSAWHEAAGTLTYQPYLDGCMFRTGTTVNALVIKAARDISR